MSNYKCLFAFCTKKKKSLSHKVFIFIHYDDIRLMFSAPLFGPILLHLSLTINEKHESDRWKWTKCVLLKLLPFRLIYSYECSWGKEFNKKYSCWCYSLCAFFLYLDFSFHCANTRRWKFQFCWILKIWNNSKTFI